MENNNLKKEEIDSFVREIVEKSIAEPDSAKETESTQILGGRVGSDDYSFSFYNPHNARFYFNFNKWNFKPIGFQSANSGHELVLESFEGCRIVVKRFQIEITNSINSIRKFVISGSDSNRADAIVKACSILELEAIDVLKKFISKFGGTSDFICISRRIKDNKILHDEIIDSVPLDAQWNDDVSKKLYNSKSKSEPRNVEFKKEIYAQNYVRNAGLKLFAPEISKEIASLHHAFDRFTLEALNPLTEQIKVHLEVQHETLKTLKSIQESVKSNSLVSREEVSDSVSDHYSIPIPLTISKYDSDEQITLKKSLNRKDRIKRIKDDWW